MKAEKDHIPALRALWRDIAEKDIEHGVDYPRIVLTLFGDLDKATARAEQAELTLRGVEGESVCSCKRDVDGVDHRGCGRHYLLALLDEANHLRHQIETARWHHRSHVEQSGKLACPTCLLDYPCPTLIDLGGPSDA